MDAYDKAWQERRLPLLLPPRRSAATKLIEWFDIRLGTAADLPNLFSVAILLQEKYFWHRRWCPEEEWEGLHIAYAECYERLHERMQEEDPPLPAVASSPAPTEPEEDDEELISFEMSSR